MKGVITGDIVNSRGTESVQEWLVPLKKCLGEYGSYPKDWEIYRGDSFQLLGDIEEIIIAAMHIKAVVKSVKNIDVRMAIGIGDVSYFADNVTESNGEAFVNSGELFEQIQKDKKYMGIRTPFLDLNAQINTGLDLAMVIMNDWSPGAALVVSEQLKNESLSQTDLAKRLHISQVAVSKALQRARYVEIREYLNLIIQQIKHLLP